MITRSRARTPGASRRTRRAIGFLWFCIVTIPVLFFSGGLAVDFTKIIVANREAQNLADAAAVAGAYQFQAGKPNLDRDRATQEAIATWRWGTADAREENATHNAAPLVRVLNPNNTPDVSVNNDLTQITVSVDYQVENLVFVRIFTSQETLAGNAESTAFVCNPDIAARDGQPTEGYCVRPEFRPQTG